jgi:hypothetical protein
MNVPCEVVETELENDSGLMIDGVEVICSRCGHFTESFGTGRASIRRCLALLREECPKKERNYYEAPDDK